MSAILCAIVGAWAWLMVLSGQVDGSLAYAFAIGGGLLLACLVALGDGHQVLAFYSSALGNRRSRGAVA